MHKCDLDIRVLSLYAKRQPNPLNSQLDFKKNSILAPSYTHQLGLYGAFIYYLFRIHPASYTYGTYTG